MFDTMVDIIAGYSCNVQCDYCTVTRQMREQNMSTAEVKKALVQGRAYGLTAVSFGGGEPTIRRDLILLVKVASMLGYTHIKIASNGLMYAYDSFVDSLVSAGVTQFNISFMGHTRLSYASIMGDERYFHLVKRGVANLVSRGALVVGDVIMKSDTYKYLSDTVEFWAELGVERFVFWLVSLTDRNEENRESLVPVTTMRPYMYRAFELARRRGIVVVSRHIPRCMLPGYHDHVWDVRQDKVFIVTPDASFWLAESRITANTHITKCNVCRVKESCMGVRRDYLDNIGDWEVEPIV